MSVSESREYTAGPGRLRGRCHYRYIQTFDIKTQTFLRKTTTPGPGREFKVFGLTLVGVVFVVLDQTSKAKVGHFTYLVFAHQDVCRSDVTMNVVVAFDEGHAGGDLRTTKTQELPRQAGKRLCACADTIYRCKGPTKIPVVYASKKSAESFFSFLFCTHLPHRSR